MMLAQYLGKGRVLRGILDLQILCLLSGNRHVTERVFARYRLAPVFRGNARGRSGV